jgi:hypothetical protein
LRNGVKGVQARRYEAEGHARTSAPLHRVTPQKMCRNSTAPGSLLPRSGFVRFLHDGRALWCKDSAARTRRGGRLCGDLVYRAGRRVRVAPALQREQPSGAGSVGPYRQGCPARSQLRAPAQRYTSVDVSEIRQPGSFGPEFAEAVSQRVDDARLTVELGSAVAANRLVGLAKNLCRSTISAARRPVGCLDGRWCQPTYVIPVLHHSLLRSAERLSCRLARA